MGIEGLGVDIAAVRALGRHVIRVDRLKVSHRVSLTEFLSKSGDCPAVVVCFLGPGKYPFETVYVRLTSCFLPRHLFNANFLR
jgi:hypothetical protein